MGARTHRDPYRSQYASPELAGEILAGRLGIDEDPRWRETGARSGEEYVRSARCGCGMACLQMILGARGAAVPPLAELGRRAIGYGGYAARPARGFGPLIYAGFVDLVAAEFEPGRGWRLRSRSPICGAPSPATTSCWPGQLGDVRARRRAVGAAGSSCW